MSGPKSNDIKDSTGINQKAKLVMSASVDKEQPEDEVLLSSDRRPAEEKALVRKLDMRLLPTIVLVFILNYIDVRLNYQLDALSDIWYQSASIWILMS